MNIKELKEILEAYDEQTEIGISIASQPDEWGIPSIRFYNFRGYWFDNDYIYFEGQEEE